MIKDNCFAVNINLEHTCFFSNIFFRFFKKKSNESLQVYNSIKKNNQDNGSHFG